MSNDTKIYITGDIDNESFLEFNELLSEIEAQGDETVNVDLISYGGDAYSALAFHDRIKISPCEVHITAYGVVASAAVVILAAGDKRRMSRNTWLMVHEDTTEATRHMKVSAVEKSVAHGRRVEEHWAQVLAESTKASASFWEKMHAEERWLTPKECFELGLIDEVLYGI